MSKDSILVIVIWVILCGINVLLWFIDTEQGLLYEHYCSSFLFIAPIVTAFFCFRTMRVFEPNNLDRKAWGLLGIGILFWSAGAIIEPVYSFLNHGEEIPYPSYADIGYLMFIPFVGIALYTVIKSLNVKVPLWGLFSAILIFLVALGFGFWISSGDFKEQLDIITFIVTVAYIVLDPILLAMTVAMASILFGGLLARPWLLTLLGLFIFYLGDVIYSYIRNNDLGLYGGGVILDLSWPIAFGLIALAATTTHAIYKD
jgi:hypothetical protein